MIRAILAFIVVFLLATFPATWLLMLFFGNIGMARLSYWGTFPLGILVIHRAGRCDRTEVRRVLRACEARRFAGNPHQASSLAFCAWNSASLMTPLSRRSASLVSSSAEPPPVLAALRT